MTFTSFTRWTRLMTAWSFAANRETYEAIVEAYAERGRHYHTLEHLAACLRHFDTCSSAMQKPHEVELALWFHDAVYKPLSAANEAASADWAAAFLGANGAAPEPIGRVRALIMATVHAAPAATHDESLLVDIDLAILGAPPDVYSRFENAVRKEYRLVPFAIFRRKRAEILRGFLARPRIFQNEPFFSSLETQARANLTHAINELVGAE